MSSLISIIVPVYNCEKYLDKCIQSILNQEHKNLEIILVDDGSTDSSSEKCDTYAQMDNRIRVIHKQNGGQSSARNVGLDICRGGYIGFVDSDDWIEPDMYSSLLEQLEKFDANLAIAGRYDVYENAEQTIVPKSMGKSGIYDAYDLLPQMTMGRISDFAVWDKLYRRELWHDFRFPEGVIFEDFAIIYKVVLAAKKVVLYDKPLYAYLHRKNSTVTSGFREALTAYPVHTRRFVSDITSWYPEYKSYAVWAHIKALQSVMIQLLRSDKKVYKAYRSLYREYVQEIKKHRDVWSKDPLFNRTDRIISQILLNRRIARLIFTIKKSKLG